MGTRKKTEHWSRQPKMIYQGTEKAGSMKEIAILLFNTMAAQVYVSANRIQMFIAGHRKQHGPLTIQCHISP